MWHERLAAARADQYVRVADDASTLIGFVCAFAGEDPVWGSYIPDEGVYLWVMEANASARAFYERLGAANAGTIELMDPGGGHAPNCRYVWPRPQLLVNK